MPETLLKQAVYTTKDTSETSSTQQLLWTFGQQWNRFHDRTKSSSWTHPFEEGTENFFVPGIGLIPTFNVTDRTRAHPLPLKAREETLRRFQRSLAPALEEEFREKLQKISQRENNWDAKGSLKPNLVALHKAYTILFSFLNAIIDNGRSWKKPFVSSDENGHITIQWNHGNQELHIEIMEDTEEYIKIWGTNIEHEMYLGFLKPSDYIALWDWLY